MAGLAYLILNVNDVYLDIFNVTQVETKLAFSFSGRI